MMGFQEADRRVGTAELGRAAQGAVGFDQQPDRALPAAVMVQANLNEQLEFAVSRLAGVAHRLEVVPEKGEPGCAGNVPPTAGLLCDLRNEQDRTARLIGSLNRLNDHLEKLI